jgi:glycosyltransferase involved in cell wall biosynthesis
LRALASDEVTFAGAVYDRPALGALRFHARGYLHGHQVGGTNPSLVEALGAGSAVIAHDNPFNRWVASDAARYFHDPESCAAAITELLGDRPAVEALRANARRRFAAGLTWSHVLSAYEALLGRLVGGG